MYVFVPAVPVLLENLESSYPVKAVCVCVCVCVCTRGCVHLTSNSRANVCCSCLGEERSYLPTCILRDHVLLKCVTRERVTTPRVRLWASVSVFVYLNKNTNSTVELSKSEQKYNLMQENPTKMFALMTIFWNILFFGENLRFFRNWCMWLYLKMNLTARKNSP